MAFIQTVKQFVTLCFEKCYTSKVVVIIRHTLLLLLLEGNAYFLFGCNATVTLAGAESHAD